MQQLYVISDENLTPYPQILDLAETALKSGARYFQLRDKTHSDAFLMPFCKELDHLCKSYNACFVINDRYELALELNIGLHLGKEELHKLNPKESLHLPILGISCYDSLELAKQAIVLGANYVAFGSCFKSPTKPNAMPISHDIFREAKSLVTNVCAIGGITPHNAHLLKDADMLAVISAIWQGDVASNIAHFLRVMHAN